ncbi:MAG: energy transducer TonB [Acidobacteria bacterium]|nr:energy transducer TonB [Acidobacteriota bacterium]
MPFHEFRITPYATDHTGDSPARVRDWRDTRKMFETTAVDSRKRGWRGMFWGMLPASIAAHVLAGVGVIAVQTWETNFPTAPPARVEAYQLMVALSLPPPPPPPPPPAAPAQATETPQKLPENVAPVAIPDVIPEVLPAPVPGSDGSDSGVEGGVEGGEIGGVVGGTEGGVLPPGPPPAPPDTIVIARDEKLPLKPLSMDYPVYPDKWRYRSVGDSLVLRYHIDKKGRVDEVVLLRAPQYREFADAAISAVRSWRFRPLMINGEPKEVLHELTVNFRIEKPEPRQSLRGARTRDPDRRPQLPNPGRAGPTPAGPTPAGPAPGGPAPGGSRMPGEGSGDGRSKGP